MSQPIVFHGVPMNVGDLIRITLSSRRREPNAVQVAVLEYHPEEHALTVLVPYYLTRFALERQWKIYERDLQKIEWVQPASEAVPAQSGTAHPFEFHDRVAFKAGGDPREGVVLAALCEFIAVRMTDGMIINGSVRFFTRLVESTPSHATN